MWGELPFLTQKCSKCSPKPYTNAPASKNNKPCSSFTANNVRENARTLRKAVRVLEICNAFRNSRLENDMLLAI